MKAVGTKTGLDSRPNNLPDTLTKQSIDSPLVIACVAGGLFCERKKRENDEGFFARSEKSKNDASWASLQISGRLVSSPKRSSLNRVEKSDDQKDVYVRGLELRRLHWLVLIRRSIIFSHDIQYSTVYSLTVWSSFVSFGYSNLQQNFS